MFEYKFSRNKGYVFVPFYKCMNFIPIQSIFGNNGDRHNCHHHFYQIINYDEEMNQFLVNEN